MTGTSYIQIALAIPNSNTLSPFSYHLKVLRNPNGLSHDSTQKVLPSLSMYTNPASHNALFN